MLPSMQATPIEQAGKARRYWGTGMLTFFPSFPRKRESSDLKGFWIPARREAHRQAGQRPEPWAAAGMTVFYSDATLSRPLYG